MGSTNKTGELELNQWIGSDVPKMEDFNKDNEIIDKILGEHIWDISKHVTAQQKKAGAIRLDLLRIWETAPTPEESS